MVEVKNENKGKHGKKFPVFSFAWFGVTSRCCLHYFVMKSYTYEFRISHAIRGSVHTYGIFQLRKLRSLLAFQFRRSGGEYAFHKLLGVQTSVITDLLIAFWTDVSPPSSNSTV
jgi:hypothetical protein